MKEINEKAPFNQENKCWGIRMKRIRCYICAVLLVALMLNISHVSLGEENTAQKSEMLESNNLKKEASFSGILGKSNYKNEDNENQVTIEKRSVSHNSIKKITREVETKTTELFKENFDGTSYEMNVYSPDGYAGSVKPMWSVVKDYNTSYPEITAHSGSGAAMFNSSDTESGNQSYLFLTGIPLISSDKIEVKLSVYNEDALSSFKDRIVFFHGFNDEDIIYWEDDDEVFYRNDSSYKYGWNTWTMTISNHGKKAGDTFTFGFQGISEWGHNMYVDTLSVSQYGTAQPTASPAATVNPTANPTAKPPEPTTITPGRIGVQSVKMNKTALKLKPKSTVRIGVTIFPSNATNKKLTWTSSNKDVATVNDSGVVTGKKPGSATITAKSMDGVWVSCKVTVPLNQFKKPGLYYRNWNLTGKVRVPNVKVKILVKGKTYRTATCDKKGKFVMKKINLYGKKYVLQLSKKGYKKWSKVYKW